MYALFHAPSSVSLTIAILANGTNSGSVGDPRPRGSAFCACEPLNGPRLVSSFFIVSFLANLSYICEDIRFGSL